MKRDAETHVHSFLDHAVERSNVLLVQGARQVGKTYLIESCLKERPKTIKINLERQPDVKLAIDSTKSFTDFTDLMRVRFNLQINEGCTVFIDEAQESEKLGSYVRFMKEEWLFTKVILTGSSMTRLFSGDYRVPVGRVEYLTIQGFSFREYLRMFGEERLLDDAKASAEISEALHEKLLSFYDDYLLVGGLPDVVIAKRDGKDFETVLNFIVAAQRDDFLRQEQVKSYLFIDALKGVANHIGSPAKYTHVAINHYDAKKILQKMQEWFLITEIEQRGAASTQSFAPKRYLYDLGILRLIRDTVLPRLSILHTLDERLRTPVGGLIENAIILQLLSGPSGVNLISGWKRGHKDAIEVDFIINRNGEPLPVEVKAALHVNERHAKNIYHYCKLFGTKRGILLSLDRPTKYANDGIEIDCLPAYLAENCYSFKPNIFV